ncbi:tautomerase family protein [Shimazuella sp. AN120528]|uniref:tautomerase family protein n=1 Tax=Shimazuella soli TaxID=1892854 RepID=UPI00210205F2|nr:tautomerase family protein [Shimazuella soli]MCH5585758.1 tautomerase family protein [Shimazuella soli]
MPFTRISLMKGTSADFRKEIGNIVYQAMIDTLNVPEKDRFQVITEHDPSGLIYDPEYLGIQRTNDILFIQLFLNEGRTVEVKKSFYKEVADKLHEQLDIRREDIFINLVEVKKEDWSYGNGIAQYAI